MQGEEAVGHPVNVATGAQFTAWHDAEIPGLVPLVFRRYYSTKLLDKTPGILGRGWVHCFGMSLRRTIDGYAIVNQSGGEVHFLDPHNSFATKRSLFNFSSSMELRAEEGQLSVFHWHNWRVPVEKFVFRYEEHAPTVPLYSVGNPAGHAVILRYDAAGRLLEARQNIERRGLVFDYDSYGRLSRLFLTSPLAGPELLATYQFDRDHRLTAVGDALGNQIRYEYDLASRLIGETNRRGASYSMRYDHEGRCIESSGAGGYKLTRLKFDTAARTTSVTNSFGETTAYKLNEAGQVTTKTLPNLGAEHTMFDNHGRIVQKIGPSGEKIATAYDDRGNVASVTSPLGGAVLFEYDADHQIRRIQQPDGGVWLWEYAKGALVSVTDPALATTEFSNDSLNVVQHIKTAAGSMLKISRDEAFSEETYSDEFGIFVGYRYDSRLHIIEVSDASGLNNRLEYDPLGFLKAVSFRDGSRRELECDPTGLVLQFRDANGHVTSYDYATYSHRTRAVQPDGTAQQYHWDSEGRISTIVNAKGEEATFKYDVAGNIASIQFFDGRTETFEYDASNRRISRTKADGTCLRFSFDAEGNLLGVSDRTGVLSTNTYDQMGRLTSTQTAGNELNFEYDARGWAVAEVQNGVRVENRFHPFGCLSERKISGGKPSRITFQCDSRRRPTIVRADGNECARYEWDSANLLVKRTVGSAIERLQYDARQRLQTQTVSASSGANVILTRTYVYDNENNLISLVDGLRGKTRYEYSSAGQLARSSVSGRPSRTYDYDACGNLLNKGRDRRLSYGAGNRLIANGLDTYEYDLNGRLGAIKNSSAVTRFFWNSFDQLVKVIEPDGGEIEMSYDGLGRRTSKHAGSVRTQYTWAGSDLIQETTGEKRINYFFGRFIPELFWENGIQRSVIHSHPSRASEFLDQRGMPVWSSTTDDWGSPTPSSQHAMRLGGPGQYWDSDLRLYYNRFRYYNPAAGRFISPDPIGYVGGFNEYWSGPNPINWIDPLGLRCGLTHNKVVVNDDLKGQGGQPDPTRADWFAKQDAFNGGIEAGQQSGNPVVVPTAAQYALDRQAGNAEAAAARIAQGMGAGVQADHPVDLRCGGGQGQALYPLASGVNGSVGSQTGSWARQQPPGTPTPMIDLYDKSGNLIRAG